MSGIETPLGPVAGGRAAVRDARATGRGRAVTDLAALAVSLAIIGATVLGAVEATDPVRETVRVSVSPAR